MQVKLSQIPFVRILVPLATGIFIELKCPTYYLFIYLGVLSFLMLLLWNWYESKKSLTYSLRWVTGALAAVFLFSTGYSIALLRTPSENKNDVSHIIRKDKDSIIVSLISIPQEKQKTIKATGEITGIIKNGSIIPTKSKSLFYFHKDSIAEKLNYGDKLLVYSSLHEIAPPSNPDEFNYKEYLQTHEINYECYAAANNYRLIAHSEANYLLGFANNNRKKLATLLHNKIGGNEAEVASAILLGYRADLSPSVIQSFVDSGVVHIICVAGLHVGIIFLLLSYIIVFPTKWKHNKLASLLSILILLWFYALFTGMATPVLRATIVFSFLTIGRYFKKYTNTINTLAASAFLILLFDPYSLADTSFQLSYLSVLGILIIYKPLLAIYAPSSIFIKKIWELLCVSMAAQIAIFPLSLLYFHQFPNYFLFSNILIVPMLTMVIILGVFFFLTSWIPFVSSIAAWALQKLILLMNSIVLGVSHLPYSVSKGISISAFETLLLFIFIICILAYFNSRKYYLFLGGLATFALFLLSRTEKNIEHAQQHILTVYNIPGKSAIAFISGTHSIMPFSTKVDSTDINFHIQYNWWKLGVKNNLIIGGDTDAIVLSGQIMLERQFVQFNNKKFVFIKQNIALPPLAGKLNLHCIIVSGDYNFDMDNLKNAFNFDTLIFDSSVPDYKLRKWEEECRKLNLHYYSVKTQGAYIENC